MAAIDLPKSPNVFHPEKPSAVGSRNSLAQEFRDQQAEVDLLMSEEVDKVMNHITSKLPKEVARKSSTSWAASRRSCTTTSTRTTRT